MPEDTIKPFGFPAVGRKNMVAAFDSGRLTSDGGVMLLGAAEQRIGIASTLAPLIPDGPLTAGPTPRTSHVPPTPSAYKARSES